MKIALAGLGNMGFSMAEKLLAKPFPLTVTNRTKEKALPLLEKGALWASSPADAAKGASIFATILSNDEALESLLYDAGVLDALPEGSVHLSLSTISIELSRTLEAEHTKRHQGFVSAPVFGRPEAVVEGRLRVLCAGAPSSVTSVMPILETLGSKVFRLGDSPYVANLVKLSGNFMIAAALEALGESFALVRSAGVDPALFLEILNDSLFRSPLYENYGKIMAEKRYNKAGFTMDLGLKDLHLILEAAESLRVPLPVASIARDSFLAGLARGRQHLDWSAIVLSHYERAGLEENR
ncbi:MAG: NAD(P)-dependent oxidoreductase [Leptospirillia bacterium]